MAKKFIYFLVPLLFWTHMSFAAADCDNAKVFMKEIGEKVISLLTNKSISDKERADQFREILETKFNGKSIAKFVLGKYWKQAAEEEKEKFLQLFKETTVAAYATRFKEYSSEKFEILSCRSESDGGVMVMSRIIRPNGQVIPIDWKIFEKDGELRIYDVSLEGISMSITQRSEFSSVIQKGGGQVQAIIQALEKKVQENKSH